jgi:hypothetical protein
MSYRLKLRELHWIHFDRIDEFFWSDRLGFDTTAESSPYCAWPCWPPNCRIQWHSFKVPGQFPYPARRRGFIPDYQPSRSPLPWRISCLFFTLHRNVFLLVPSLNCQSMSYLSNSDRRKFQKLALKRAGHFNCVTKGGAACVAFNLRSQQIQSTIAILQMINCLHLIDTLVGAYRRKPADPTNVAIICKDINFRIRGPQH